MQHRHIVGPQEEYALGSSQEHALICEKHNAMPMDVICEDCEDFICTKCVKEDHKDHDWDTITSAATRKKRVPGGQIDYTVHTSILV